MTDWLIPIEIKAGQTVTREYFKGLEYYTQLSAEKTKNAYIVYAGDQKQISKRGHVLGWQYLPEEMQKINQ